MHSGPLTGHRGGGPTVGAGLTAPSVAQLARAQRDQRRNRMRACCGVARSLSRPLLSGAAPRFGWAACRAAGGASGSGAAAGSAPSSSGSSGGGGGGGAQQAGASARVIAPASSGDGSGGGPLPSFAMPLTNFEVSLEEVLHHRYLTLYNRRVRFSAPGHDPSQARELNFDVVGHPSADYQFAVTFPFHPRKDGQKGGDVTVIREYAQGPNCLMYCLPTGGFSPGKHADLQACAKAELSEEAWLAGGRWVPLLPPEHPGLAEVKWCMNRFRPFLVIDPHSDDDPGSRDLEEVSMEVMRMPIEEFKQLMLGGDMLLPSITTGYMAMDKLREEGYL